MARNSVLARSGSTAPRKHCTKSVGAACLYNPPRTDWKNAAIRSGDFFPGLTSTPLTTSTPPGCSAVTASHTFSGRRPPATTSSGARTWVLRESADTTARGTASAAAAFLPRKCLPKTTGRSVLQRIQQDHRKAGVGQWLSRLFRQLLLGNGTVSRVYVETHNLPQLDPCPNGIPHRRNDRRLVGPVHLHRRKMSRAHRLGDLILIRNSEHTNTVHRVR